MGGLRKYFRIRRADPRQYSGGQPSLQLVCSVVAVRLRLVDTGRPKGHESLDAWRSRLREQQVAAVGHEQEKQHAGPRARKLHVPPEGKVKAVSFGPTPLPKEDGGSYRLLHEQFSSSAGLDVLMTGNPGALEEVQRAINAAADAGVSPDAELGGTENRRKLDRLVKISAQIGEIVVSNMLRHRCLDTSPKGKRDELKRVLRIRDSIAEGLAYIPQSPLFAPREGISLGCECTQPGGVQKEDILFSQKLDGEI